MPEPDRHDVGETPSARIEREKVTEQEVKQVAGHVRSRVRTELVLFGGLLILFCAAGWALLADQDEEIERTAEIAAGAAAAAESFAFDLRDANVRGCERQNEIKAALNVRIRQDISDAHRDIRTTERTNPALFPDIPLEKFQQLIDRRVRRLKNRVDALREQIPATIPSDCEAAYPLPEGEADERLSPTTP